ncbi:MAG: tRNA (adenosine(37)-N6)-threonylcarbamoyltransferase complex transferase subunit TsaD [Elusimicrobia bacterium RIFOXYA2_FULL_39_19]|nr:MAG: tRNA (adenosine(37)-N6)-threonylcarbamoyltransferase complex transferase subunit TsaD [Elusimicrobia bacterium RIFOXYA2_FULL_39_19]
MITLGIETSCDETAVALIENGRKILSNVVSSQQKMHAQYFGVVPELASRAHLENINYVFEKAVTDAGFTLVDLHKKDVVSAISVTAGPGLMGSLLLGWTFANTISYLYKKPLVPVNHLEGHIFGILLEHPQLKPPFLSLIVSGGHTELVLVKNFGSYKVLGKTRDDAAGEAFDKVAKLLNLTYPGGPVIEKSARGGNASAVKFTRPYLWENWDFSFSGLKTAVVYYVRDNAAKIAKDKTHVNDICASFQSAVVDTLVDKTIEAAKKFKMKNVVIGGGVTANGFLKDTFISRGKANKIHVYVPSRGLCTDNAAMIASVGYYKYKSAKAYKISKFKKYPDPNMELEDWNV